MVHGVVVQIATAAPASSGRLGVDERKAHPDRRAGVVVIFDLGLGQGGLLDHGPHHRLLAAIKRAAEQELAKLAIDAGFGTVGHRRVRVGPVAEHAQSFELGLLHVDPALGILAAFAAEVGDRDRVLVLALLAVLLLDLPLDRQAVAVPARHVGRVLAQHLLAAVDHVLENLVQRRAHVDVGVGIGWAIVQHELLAPGRRLAQAGVEVHALPTGGEIGLPLGQVGLHREIGARQKHRVAVVGGHGRELAQAGMRAWMARAWSQSRAICALSSSTPGNLRSPRN